MKEYEFMKELESRLKNFSEIEKNKILFYYDDLIYGAVENGIKEEDAIRELGSIDEIVKKIKGNFSEENLKEVDDKPFKKLNPSAGLGKRRTIIKENDIETLNVSTKSRRVLFESILEDHIEIEHFNSPFAELFLSTKGNALYVDHNTNKFKSYIVRATIIICISALFLFLFPNKWWLKLILFFSCYATLQGIFELSCLFLKVNTIKIKVPDKKYNLSISGKSGSFKSVGIPYKNINATTNSGSLRFYNTKANSFYLKSASGSIKLVNDELDIPLVTNDIVTLAKSGSIKVCNYNCKNVICRCNSGSIKLIKLDCQNNIEMINSSGAMKGINLSAHDLNAKSKSGTIKFRGLNCVNSLDSRANSGSVKGSDVLSPRVNSSVKSGMIKYKALVSNDIKLSAISGVVKTIDSTFTKAIASSTSGSVKFLRTRGRRKDYNLNLHSNSGLVKVKELTIDNSSFVDEKSNTIDKSLSANTKSGIIKVTFLNIGQ